MRKQRAQIKTFSSKLEKLTVRPKSLLLFAVVFAGIGSALLILTHAATPTASIEPESATLSGNAITGSDSNASGGGYVQFKAPASGGGGSNPTGEFYILGTNIVDPNGNKYFPVGANVGIAQNFDWRGVGTGHVNDAIAWGWNTVRLTIDCTDTYNYNIWYTSGYPALISAVDGFVQEYTAQKIVVIIECHDAETNRGEADQFWGDIATKYKNNPYVWFNAVNEPEWNDNAAWVALQQHYLQVVRSKGAENIFVADVMNAGNDAGWDGANYVYDPTMGPVVKAGQCNVLFSQHNYGGVDSGIGSNTYWDNVHAAGLAMIIGEFGYTIDGSSTAGTYQQNVTGANSVFTIAPSKGIGMLWWHATHGDNYSLKNNGNAFYDGGDNANLSAGGQSLWNISHNKPNLGAYTGTYAPSNCSSAAGH